MLLLLLVTACWSPLGSVEAARPVSVPDFSGLEPFWEIAEVLATGGEPSEAQWAELLATPGYRSLEEHDRASRFLERLLPLAVAPGREADIREAVAGQPFVQMFISHLRSAYEQREELEAFRARLERQPLLDRALNEAQAWLPDESTSRFGAPEISFVIFQPDARGYEHIIVDLLMAYEQPSIFEALLAHEAHHVIRNEIRGTPHKSNLPEAQLLLALENLQAEGIADRIDKPALLRINDDGHGWGESSTDTAFRAMVGRFRDELARVSERLAEVDRILTAYGNDAGDAHELGARMRETLVMGGHPVGYHMASVIVAAGGRDRMVDGVADPFDFVRAYQEAATTDADNHHVFSEAALRGLAKLERTYREADAPR